MSPTLDLVFLCTVMAVSTFLFGVLPLALRLSRLTLRILEVGGAGLLLGAACSVVMPEGAGTLFREGGEAHHNEEHHHKDPETLLAVSFLAGVLVLYVIDQIMAPGPHVHTHEPHAAGDEHPTARHDPPTRDCPEERPFSRLTRPETLHLTRSSMNFGSKGSLRSESNSQKERDGSRRLHGTEGAQEHAGHGHKQHASNGSRESDESSEASLPSDYHTIPHDGQSFPNQVSGGLWRKGHPADHTGSSPSSPLLRSPPRSPPRRRTSQELRPVPRNITDDSNSGKARGLRAAFTSVAGLVIHAACDGIAMGASSASQDEGLKLVVVAAIMIHKAPAAFGLCTLLLSRRLSRNDVRRAMAIFSLATPIGALLTYFALSTLLNSSTSSAGAKSGPTVSPSQVGAALTFSAGSFIYVALHAVHELASPSSDYEMETTHSEPAHARLSTSDEHHSTQPHHGSADDHSHSHSREHTHTVIPKQTLGRFGRIVVLLIGAVLPRGLQLIFGHGH